MNNKKAISGLSRFTPWLFAALLTFLLSYSGQLIADTLTLKDGTVLSGKIIRYTKKKIVFSNSYGVFRIKKKDVREKFVTKRYEEDVEIHKKLGKVITEQTIEKIKNDYNVGEEKKEEMQKLKKKKVDEDAEDETGALRTGGLIGISGSYAFSFGRIADVLPVGYSGHIFIDQGLDMLWGSDSSLLPELRVEGGYLFFKKDAASLKGYFSLAGPIWTFPLAGEDFFNIVFAVLPGASYLDVQKKSEFTEIYNAKITTFMGQSILGFQFSWDNVSMFIDCRYIYIYDKDVFFSSVNGEFGIGFKLW